MGNNNHQYCESLFNSSFQIITNSDLIPPSVKTVGQMPVAEVKLRPPPYEDLFFESD